MPHILTKALAALAIVLATPQIGRGDPRPVWETVPAPAPLPALDASGAVERDGARIWYGSVGEGPPVILLHPGLASSDFWGDQVPALVAAHRRVILVDARGQGRSSWNGRPLSYEAMAGDVIAVMDALCLERADIVGWSDGAIVALVLAAKDPDRVTRVFAFGANMDVGGLRPIGALASTREAADRLEAADYAQVSPTPDRFAAISRAVRHLQMSQPSYTADNLAAIRGPAIDIVDADHEEFIHRRHTEYLARMIPGAQLQILPGASHFAPLQAPEAFNKAVLDFLNP